MNTFEMFLAGRPGHFITAADIPALVQLHRLCQVYVRCGACRFTCAAQDLEHLKKCIDAGGDYVRDVAITPAEVERAPTWRPEPKPIPVAKHYTPAEVHKIVDKLRQDRRIRSEFNEADCGGVFDGINTVTSDADPGL